jgi:hypothetical protein
MKIIFLIQIYHFLENFILNVSELLEELITCSELSHFKSGLERAACGVWPWGAESEYAEGAVHRGRATSIGLLRQPPCQ